MSLCRQLDDTGEALEFECNRWLDVKEDDGLIVREITAGGSQLLNSESCSVETLSRNYCYYGCVIAREIVSENAKGSTCLSMFLLQQPRIIPPSKLVTSWVLALMPMSSSRFLAKRATLANCGSSPLTTPRTNLSVAEQISSSWRRRI